MPHKRTAARSRPPVDENPEDEHMPDVEEGGEDVEAEASEGSEGSDDLYEDSENENDGADDNQNENEGVAPDESQFIGLDVSTIKSEKYTILRHKNQFRFQRSATMSMFHTLFQQHVYHIIYAKKKFANHRFVKWNYIGKKPIFNGLHSKFRTVRLETLASLHCNFHAKAIRQFYATVFVSPDFDHLIWMTGHQRLEASRDDFISALSLGDSTGIKIHLEEPLALTLLDEYYEPGIPHMHGRVSGLLPIPSVVNRIMRSSFFPRSGNNDEIHGRAWNVIKYIMDGTRFDVMDLIIREIATSKGDKTKSIYFAPYIMKLILSKIDFTEVCDVEHKEYQPRVAPPQAPPPPPPAPFQPSEQITDTQSHPGQQASQAQDPALAAILRLQTSIDARFDRMDARNEQMHAEKIGRASCRERV